MNENDGKEFAELGVKEWLIKQLFTLGKNVLLEVINIIVFRRLLILVIIIFIAKV